MAEVLTDALAEYLDACIRVPTAWGTMDCTMFAANWVHARTGLDPAAAWRGAYRSAEEGRAMIVDAGGLLALVSPSMAALGFVETADPQDGDVGVVIAPMATDDGGAAWTNVAAIRQGGLWVCRSTRGIVGMPFLTVRAWRLG